MKVLNIGAHIQVYLLLLSLPLIFLINLEEKTRFTDVILLNRPIHDNFCGNVFVSVCGIYRGRSFLVLIMLTWLIIEDMKIYV